MVGSTVRTLQGAGWLPIHAIDVELAVLARAPGSACSRRGRRSARQVVALAFVIGSYFAAEYVRVKRPRRRRRPVRSAPAPAPVRAAEPEQPAEPVGAAAPR